LAAEPRRLLVAGGTGLSDDIRVLDLAEAPATAIEALARSDRSAAYNPGAGRPHSIVRTAWELHSFRPSGYRAAAIHS
jgi:UDP-glucose 4-epimerase